VESLNEFIKLMVDTLKDAKQFAQSEIPALFKEIIQYHIAKESLYLGLTLLFMFLSYGVMTRSSARLEAGAPPEDVEGLQFFYYVPKFGVIPICLFVAIQHAVHLSQLLIAPRLFLLEYFKSLVSR